MRVCIVGGEDTWHTCALTTAFARRQVAVDTVRASRLRALVGERPAVAAGQLSLDAAALVLVRTIPAGSLEQIIFRMDVLHVLEALGIPVANPPRSIEQAVDKYLASKLVELHGLPTPRTFVTESFDEAMDLLRQWGDVVVKPLFGGQGIGMVRLNDPDVAFRTFKALQLGRYVYYLQEYVPHGTEDIRTFVVEDRVVAAMTRRGASWKTNVAQGATPVALNPDPQVIDLSLRASAALGTFYAGVDLLRGPGGRLYVIEVNSMPGWKGLQATATVDIAQTLVDALLQARARRGRL